MKTATTSLSLLNWPELYIYSGRRSVFWAVCSVLEALVDETSAGRHSEAAGLTGNVPWSSADCLNWCWLKYGPWKAAASLGPCSWCLIAVCGVWAHFLFTCWFQSLQVRQVRWFTSAAEQLVLLRTPWSILRRPANTPELQDGLLAQCLNCFSCLSGVFRCSVHYECWKCLTAAQPTANKRSYWLTDEYLIC